MHRHYYHRLIGAREYVLHNYDNALKAYLNAERLDKELQWVGVGLYYACAKCLSDMGYIARAVDYYKKARHYARWHKPYDGKSNRKFDVDIDGQLASCLSKLGMIDEAITILEKRLNREVERNISKASIGFTYFSFGRVYSNIGNYEDALQSFEKAFPYLKEGSEAYTANLYYKTMALIANGNISEAALCMEKNLVPDTSKLWNALFNALRHSISLSEPDSILYMTRTAIPNLKKYGHYEEVTEYYEMISDFYKKDKNYELALKYSNLAYEMFKRLYKERIEGGI